MSWDAVKYRELKFKFFSILKTKNLMKGDIRAFIGLKTWIYEQEKLDKGDDPYATHLLAFEEALNDFQTTIKSRKFDEEFSQAQKIWEAKGENLSRVGMDKILLPSPIPKITSVKRNGLSVISLFSGALGLDLGFLAAGFDLILANDIDKNSYETVIKNLPSTNFILKDFAEVTKEEILAITGLEVGELDVLTGGPPCQPFSTAGRRQGLSDPRASPLREFIRAIKELRPRAFVMEEVPGLLSARLQHIPIKDRANRKLAPEEMKGSVFKIVLEMLKSTGYQITYDILNAADYGTPQKRERLIVIGLREGIPEFPMKTHTDQLQMLLSSDPLEPWNTFWECTADLKENKSEYVSFSQNIELYMRLIPPGGHWRHLPEDKIERAMGGAFTSGGGRRGFYRRLSWDEPSPTVVTSPVQKGSIFGHPEALRPLSVKEYKRIQGFPDDWEIVGKNSIKYKLIGNAVPVHLSYAIAKKVKELLGESTMSDKLHEMLALVFENDAGLKTSRGRTVASYFSSIQDFEEVTKEDLMNLIGFRGKKTIKLAPEEIESILKVRDDGLVDPKAPITDNFLTAISRAFTKTQLKMINKLTLTELNPNPLLIRLLNLGTPDELVRLYVYSRVSRSIVTSMGFFVEKLLLASSDSVIKGPRGSGWDIVKTDEKGKEHWVQVKSGPSDMDKDQVEYWSKKIEEKIKEGNSAYIGITYGKKEMKTITLNFIKQIIPDWELKLLVGRDLWDFISGDTTYHNRLFDIFRRAAVFVLQGNSICDEIEKCINRIEGEFIEIYGNGTEGVNRYLEELF